MENAIWMDLIMHRPVQVQPCIRPTRISDRPDPETGLSDSRDGSATVSEISNPISTDPTDSTTNEAADPHRIYDFSIGYLQIRCDSIEVKRNLFEIRQDLAIQGQF